jgi:GTP cyclohydrolase III
MTRKRKAAHPFDPAIKYFEARAMEYEKVVAKMARLKPFKLSMVSIAVRTARDAHHAAALLRAERGGL